MKNASFIVSHLRVSPEFKNLKKEQSYKKLLLFLPKSLTNGILFMYHKNDTLFFVLKHQLFLMEFKSIQRSDKYRQNFIKTKLKELIGIDSECKCIDATNIKAVVAKHYDNKEEEKSNSLPLYIEKSKGKFKNNITDKKLHNIAENIREIICSKQP